MGRGVSVRRERAGLGGREAVRCMVRSSMLQGERARAKEETEVVGEGQGGGRGS